MEYIATVYTKTGHYYLGPDEDLKGIIDEAKEDIILGVGEFRVEQVYINPFDPETSMPDNDSDPRWMWIRPR